MQPPPTVYLQTTFTTTFPQTPQSPPPFHFSHPSSFPDDHYSEQKAKNSKNLPTSPSQRAAHWHWIYLLHFSPVDLLHAEGVHFCSFVTTSNQPCSNFHTNIFTSFHMTLIHGESHGIFTSPPSLLHSLKIGLLPHLLPLNNFLL